MIMEWWISGSEVEILSAVEDTVYAVLGGYGMKTGSEMMKLYMYCRHSCHLSDAGTYIIGPRPTLSAHAYVIGGIDSGRQ